MNNLNSVILEGNVVKQPDLLEPKQNFKVCTIPLAVSRFYKDSDGEGVNEVSFFEVKTFNGMAESVQKNCIKGRGIRVVGRLKQDRWKDESGKMMSKMYIVAEHIEYKPKVNFGNSVLKKDSKALKVESEANSAAYQEEALEEATSF